MRSTSGGLLFYSLSNLQTHFWDLLEQEGVPVGFFVSLFLSPLIFFLSSLFSLFFSVFFFFLGFGYSFSSPI